MIHCACRRGCVATLHFGSRCGACSMPATASTVCARSGGSYSARGSTSRAARSHDSCGQWAWQASSVGSPCARRSATARHHARGITACPGEGRGQPAVPRANAGYALGLRLYLHRDLGRVRLCGVRHRHVRTADRRLAGKPHGPCRLRPRCARAGTPRSPTDAQRRSHPPLRSR